MKTKLLVLALSFLTGCVGHGPKIGTIKPGIQARDALHQHTDVFRKGVVRVADNVHVAIGYGLANSVMIEGEDGLIIVDTMETRDEARTVLAEFRRISAKPVKAIVYTHNHTDHIFGADVFAAAGDPDDNPDIYAHDSTHYYVNRVVSELRPAINIRSMRMFGTFLDEDGLVNAGIGPFLGIGRAEATLGYIPPTKTISDKLETEIAGVPIHLIYAPGETNDQIYVWLPNQKLLICGDNFYWTFPNLYTIRGTPFRSLKQWYQSLDIIRDLRPEHLIPCHTRPLEGKDRIYAIITNYRDAIQFIHDQSLRGINMGLTPDELVEYVDLPPHLKNAPYLQPFYGQVSWAVRAMFSGNIGWFDGDAATLNPLSRQEQACMMADLAGGEAALLDFAQQTLQDKRYQAALQLSGHLLRLSPDNKRYKYLRVTALTALGEQSLNPNARHYYLTEALEIRDNFIARSQVAPEPAMLRRFPLANFFNALGVFLDPIKSRDKNIRVLVKFPEVPTAFVIHVRQGVAEVKERPIKATDVASADIIVSADAQKWKEMLSQIRSPVLTLPQFTYEKGSLLGFARFMRLFEPPPAKLPYAPYESE